MKTKPANTKAAKAAKPAPATRIKLPVEMPPPPNVTLEPELDLEPWKVITTKKEAEGKVIARLQYRGRTIMKVGGFLGESSLKDLAAQFNARRTVPILHKKAYADLSEDARARAAAKDENLNNIMQPLQG